MFLESFNEVENFTITKFPLGGSNKCTHIRFYKSQIKSLIRFYHYLQKMMDLL